MKEWKIKRSEEISEHILITHIVYFLIFCMAIISLSKIHFYNILSINFTYTYITMILWVLFASGIVLYTSRKLASGLKLGDRPTPWDFSLFFITLLLSAVILSITGQSSSPVKILLLIPVVISSSSYGKIPGLATAGAAAAILLYFDFTSGFASSPSVTFQADLVNCAVMLTLAWLIGGLADIEKEVRENLTSLANTDELTGLANHRHFQEILREGLQSAGANNNPFSMILFDIDHFKFYNDNYGHLKGDEVLQKIGEILKTMVKTPGIPARYGGDEFTVLVPDTEKKALKLAEEIRKEIESCVFEGEEILPKGELTVSVGVATFPKHGKTPKELIRSADEALYKAKYSKNKVQLYFSVMDELREGIIESEKDLFNSIKTLVSIINAKDRYTYGHSERVSYYCLKMAEKLNYNNEQKVLLRYSSFLHDIGKIEISRDVLNKIGPLRSNEWAVLKKHPVWGSDIIRPISSLKKAIPIILHHHENFDGTGYPGGLSGEEIPFESRILRVVDSFDAMTTDRPYKKAKTLPEAFNELKKYRGIIYDPFLADLFIELIIEESEEHPDLGNIEISR